MSVTVARSGCPPLSRIEPYTTALRCAVSSGTASSAASRGRGRGRASRRFTAGTAGCREKPGAFRSEEHTAEIQSLTYFVCRLFLLKKKNTEQIKGLDHQMTLV